MNLLLKRLISFLPIPFIIVFMNYAVDPANLFKGGLYEKRVADILSKNNDVANLTNFNGRLVVKHYINSISRKKDILVFGASSSTTIGSRLFPGKSLFNNSVAAGSIADFMAFYWMYRMKGLLPSTVIIGLDPWVLNRNNGIVINSSVRKEYDEAMDFLKISDKDAEHTPLGHVIPEKYLELLSPAYFQTSVIALMDKLHGRNSKQNLPRPADNTFDEESGLSADGVLIPSVKRQRLTIDEVRMRALNYANNPPVPYLENFKKLDPDSLRRLNAFIDLLSKDGVKIIFYFPPYHPDTYRVLANSEKYRIINDAQIYFESLARKRGIKTYGSYNPSQCNMTDADFYDHIHMKLESIKKIFR